MTELYPSDGINPVHASVNAAQIFSTASDLKIFPGYHSAVNAVTRPNQAVWITQYFVSRWMPLLGGNGTMIVLALRRGGFFDRRTGKCRDEIIVARHDLAAAAGMSEDTLTRELGVSRKTGKPNNPWLHHFVKPRRRSRRNSLGQMQQVENAYWVSMDDPVFPDDWPLVEAAAEAGGWQRDKILDCGDTASPPETQTASSVDLQDETPETQTASSVEPETQTAVPETQFAPESPQTAGTSPQNAAPETQTASALRIDSSLLFSTQITTTTPDSDTHKFSLCGDAENVVVCDFDLNDFWNEEPLEDEESLEVIKDKAEPQSPAPPQQAPAALPLLNSSALVTSSALVASSNRALAAAMQAAAQHLGECSKAIGNACNDLWEMGYKPEEVLETLHDAVLISAQDKRDGKVKSQRSDGQPDVVRYFRGVLKRKIDAVRLLPPKAKTYSVDRKTLETLVPSHPAHASGLADEFAALPLAEQGEWLDAGTKHMASRGSRNKTMIRLAAIKMWWAVAYPDAACAYHAAQDARTAELAKRDSIRQRRL
ncbi:MAG: hypothetical protein ACRYFS_20750 [Janthinobacterium lividum]